MKNHDLISTVTMETVSMEIPSYQIVPYVRNFRLGYHGNEDQIWKLNFNFILCTSNTTCTQKFFQINDMVIAWFLQRIHIKISKNNYDSIDTFY